MTTNMNASGNGSSGSASSTSPVSRFLSRLSNNGSGAQAASTGQPSSPPRSPFGSGRMHHVYTLHPLQSTVARFELKGLGDPFYRLFGGEPNPDYGNVQTLVKMLEAGGEKVASLKARLDEDWQRCQLSGAIVIYRWNNQTWKVMTTPPETAQKPSSEGEDENTDDTETPQKVQHTRFQALRALDLSLVLNVLGRSHTQVLMPHTPLMFTQTTLQRSLMSDDTRLLALVNATGYLAEEQTA